MCIVRPDGPPQLCKTDEIGEIVINSRAGGNMYYGLPGLTKNTFEVGGQDYTSEQPAVTQAQKIKTYITVLSVCGSFPGDSGEF